MMKKHILSYNNFYFIGIGGASMSSLAQIMLSLGKIVSGSDLAINDNINHLKKLKIKVNLSQIKSNVKDDVQVVVYTTAINFNNEEYLEFKKRDVIIIERAELLGILSNLYYNSVAIAGTHGKTTTTAMIGHIMLCSGLNPTIHLGGESIDFGGVHIGGNNLFVTEACEYKNAFKYLTCDTHIITNIEKDHMDYYKNFDAIISAFKNFSRNAKQQIIVFGKYLPINSKLPQFCCGFDTFCDFYCYNVKNYIDYYTFEITNNGNYLGKFRLNLMGEHNVKNALLAICYCYIQGVRLDVIYDAILSFRGVKRRYEYVGDLYKTKVICDYAHHPTEIENSIAGLKEKYKNILCVFQPHTFSRTKKLFKEFKGCFENCNNLIIYKTYPAREVAEQGYSAQKLYESLHFPKRKKTYCDNLVELKVAIKKVIDTNKVDLILVLGAGDIYNHINKLIKKLPIKLKNKKLI